MSINPVLVCSVVIVALASAHDVSRRTDRPTGPAMATNASVTGSEHGDDTSPGGFCLRATTMLTGDRL
jgi:hypothetical protein